VPAVSSLPATSTRRRSRSALYSGYVSFEPEPSYQDNMFGNLTFLRKWDIYSILPHILTPPPPPPPLFLPGHNVTSVDKSQISRMLSNLKMHLPCCHPSHGATSTIKSC
jgi:hypothetical protein